jgi:hypothetical protein
MGAEHRERRRVARVGADVEERHSVGWVVERPRHEPRRLPRRRDDDLPERNGEAGADGLRHRLLPRPGHEECVAPLARVHLVERPSLLVGERKPPELGDVEAAAATASTSTPTGAPAANAASAAHHRPTPVTNPRAFTIIA